MIRWVRMEGEDVDDSATELCLLADYVGAEADRLPAASPEIMED